MTGARAKTAKWDAVDFSQPSGAIAFEMGVAEQVVSYHRRKRGINIRQERWRGVDWSKSNSEIADELGVSREAVRYQKCKRNLLAKK